MIEKLFNLFDSPEYENLCKGLNEKLKIRFTFYEIGVNDDAMERVANKIYENLGSSLWCLDKKSLSSYPVRVYRSPFPFFGYYPEEHAICIPKGWPFRMPEDPFLRISRRLDELTRKEYGGAQFLTPKEESHILSPKEIKNGFLSLFSEAGHAVRAVARNFKREPPITEEFFDKIGYLFGCEILGEVKQPGLDYQSEIRRIAKEIRDLAGMKRNLKRVMELENQLLLSGYQDCLRNLLAHWGYEFALKNYERIKELSPEERRKIISAPPRKIFNEFMDPERIIKTYDEVKDVLEEPIPLP